MAWYIAAVPDADCVAGQLTNKDESCWMSEIASCEVLVSTVSNVASVRCVEDAESDVPKAMIRATDAIERMMSANNTSTSVSPDSERSLRGFTVEETRALCVTPRDALIGATRHSQLDNDVTPVAAKTSSERGAARHMGRSQRSLDKHPKSNGFKTSAHQRHGHGLRRDRLHHGCSRLIGTRFALSGIPI